MCTGTSSGGVDDELFLKAFEDVPTVQVSYLGGNEQDEQMTIYLDRLKKRGCIFVCREGYN